MTTYTSSYNIAADESVASGAAIQYGAAAVTITIDSGIDVFDSGDNAAVSNYTNSTLINGGSLVSSVDAVHFQGSSASVLNNAGREIIGRSDGVFLSGAGDTLTNHGSIAGLLYQGVTLGGGPTAIFNDGDIYGRGLGVGVYSSAATITNAGSIRSDHYGIEVLTQQGWVTTITNSGIISGSDAAIYTTSTSGALILSNSGTLNGGIADTSATGNDDIINVGHINGDVHLGGGSDAYNGSGGFSGAVFGEDGNDVLIGGRGQDLLFGGAGQDTFEFVTLADLSKKPATADIIADFSQADHDLINLANLDASSAHGVQHFHLVTHGFTAPGQIREVFQGGNTLLEFNTDKDAAPEAYLRLIGHVVLHGTDILS